ncbi:unnamed protein product [Polarella glacialis]|uniref:Uncharacterized protein n=1 Tax=Polarella glacialis TaxID=89957 RepID=A0A813G580_POLGL|nr:unnamed protein product [Polarella glacialis]
MVLSPILAKATSVSRASFRCLVPVISGSTNQYGAANGCTPVDPLPVSSVCTSLCARILSFPVLVVLALDPGHAFPVDEPPDADAQHDAAELDHGDRADVHR